MNVNNRRHFIRQTGYGVVTLGFGPLLFQCRHKADTYTDLPNFTRVSPESQGVEISSIFKFIEAAEVSGLEWHSYMLLRNGKVIAEGWWKPFAPEFKHTLYSLSKSFTSTAIGLAVSEGLLTVEDPVVTFFPEYAIRAEEDMLKKMRVKHLLTMTAGHEEDTFPAILENYEEPWLPIFFDQAVEHEPGTHFKYNTGASFVLSAIVQKVSGQKLADYLGSRLFEPLGIKDYDWEESPEGINAGGFGLRITTEAIARFGQLFLQKGMWNGNQIVAEYWIREASSRQVDSNPGDGQWSQGYGYQFWRCKPENVYRGDGAFGQFCIVMPDQNAVLAVTSESKDMAKSMEVIFEYLLPSMKDKSVQESTSWENLKNLSAQLMLPVQHSVNQHMAPQIANKWYVMTPNPYGITKMQWQFRDGLCTWICETNEGTNQLVAGIENWSLSSDETRNLFPVFFRTSVPSKISSSAYWIQPSRLLIKSKFVESIHGDEYTIAFQGDQVQIFFLNSLARIDNSARNAEKRQSISGRRVAS